MSATWITDQTDHCLWLRGWAVYRYLANPATASMSSCHSRAQFTRPATPPVLMVRIQSDLHTVINLLVLTQTVPKGQHHFCHFEAISSELWSIVKRLNYYVTDIVWGGFVHVLHSDIVWCLKSQLFHWCTLALLPKGLLQHGGRHSAGPTINSNSKFEALY